LQVYLEILLFLLLLLPGLWLFFVGETKGLTWNLSNKM